MNELIYLNGQFLTMEDALISPNDRGFVFADGVYEVIKYYNGKPLRYKDHIDRLIRSLGEIQVSVGNIDEFEAISLHLLKANQLIGKQAGIYMQITRGVHKRMHQFPVGIKPTVYIFAFAFPSFSDNIENGIKVITHEDIRWLRCDIKSVALLPNTMLFTRAVEHGAVECILVRDGKVTEATHSNVLAVKSKKIITHPISNLILPGITRKIILEICAENNIPVEERALFENELYEVDELMVAGTGNEITPVIEVNGKPVGNKKPGELTRFLQQKFYQMT